jgi:iron complex outermembrane receptor protein
MPKRISLKNNNLILIPLLTIPFSGNVFAEEIQRNSSDPALVLDSMSVTAPVSDAKLGGIDVKTLPVASTIVNEEEINRLKYVDPDEILDRIPGESQTRNLRIPVGNKSYTVPMIDGAALTSPLRGSTQAFGNTVNAQDIERIEIFKGPVSALYPNNAFGGVINVVSKSVSTLPEQNSRFWFEAGNYDRYRGGGSTQGTVNGVGYVFDLNTWNIGNYRDQVKITDNLGNSRVIEAGEERHQASGKLIFHPDEQSSLTLRFMYLKDHQSTPGSIFESDFIQNDKGIGRDGTFSDQETYFGAAIYKNDLTERDHLNANVTVRRLASSGISRFSGAHDDMTTDINGKMNYKHDFDFWNSNFIIGTDIYSGINDDFNPSRVSRRRTTPASYDYGTTDIYAGFAQIQFSPIEELQITAGFRHESIDLTYKNTTVNGVVTPVPDKSFSATLPKVGIRYDFLENHHIWAAYGEGFLVPTISQLYTGRGPNPNLKPEEAGHYEIGLRGHFPLLGGKFRYETSYYYQDIKNFIVSSDLNNVTQNVNAGRVVVQGTETVLEYQPNQYFRVGVTHTYAHNIYRQYIDSNGVDLSGEELSRSPEHHVNGRIAVMPLEGLAIELEVDALTSYTTLNNASQDPKGRFERGERINLRLTYDKGPYELWFHALNLADEKIDRAGFNTRQGERDFRTVDGFQIYGGIAYNF